MRSLPRIGVSRDFALPSLVQTQCESPHARQRARRPAARRQRKCSAAPLSWRDWPSGASVKVLVVIRRCQPPGAAAPSRPTRSRRPTTRTPSGPACQRPRWTWRDARRLAPRGPRCDRFYYPHRNPAAPGSGSGVGRIDPGSDSFLRHPCHLLAAACCFRQPPIKPTRVDLRHTS